MRRFIDFPNDYHFPVGYIAFLPDQEVENLPFFENCKHAHNRMEQRCRINPFIVVNSRVKSNIFHFCKQRKMASALIAQLRKEADLAFVVIGAFGVQKACDDFILSGRSSFSFGGMTNGYEN